MYIRYMITTHLFIHGFILKCIEFMRTRSHHAARRSTVALLDERVDRLVLQFSALGAAIGSRIMTPYFLDLLGT